MFVLSFLCALSPAWLLAQTEETVFSDDFEDGELDESKWRIDRNPFESGGNEDAINATEANGIIEFSGTASEQWWSGISIATLPTFTASRETNLVITVDRVSVEGEGSAYRSNVWLTEEGRSRYVFFGEDVGETGWQYNRQILLPGDNPTGSGTGPGVWDALEDGGMHQMKLIANGETVKLFVDDVQGAEVDFPLKEGIVFEVGGYARAEGDSVTAQFDNVTIAKAECAAFLERDIVMDAGETATATVQIPAALNAEQEVQMTVTSSDPATARPVDGTDGSLTLTFPAGGANTQTFEVETLQQGAANFTLETASPVCIAGDLFVTSPFGVGVHIDDDFSGDSIDTSVWEITNQGLEDGTGNFEVTQEGGTLTIDGDVTGSFWGGATLKSTQGFTATSDLNLVFEVDRLSRQTPGVGRSDVIIANADRSQFVAFGERFVAEGLSDVPDPGWVVSSSFTDPTGSGGTIINAFDDKLDGGSHHVRLVADGETVEIFLDGESGGKFDFPVQSGIHLELGGFGELEIDTVTAEFDNARLSTELACITASPQDALLQLADTGNEVTVRVPEPLLESEGVNVTVTSTDPSVAVPAGATDGSLTLNFAAGGPNTQSFEIATRGIGKTTFELSSDSDACTGPAVDVTVNPVPLTFVSDDFSAGIDDAVWQIDEMPLEDGVAADGTEVIVTDEDQVRFNVIAAEGGIWPGRALTTVETFAASQDEPLTFKVDRVSHEANLVTGTGAQQRTGAWIMDESGENFIFFFDNNTSSGVQGGWKYFQNDIAGDGTVIGPLNQAEFNDRGDHRVKIVADGSTVRLFLDDVLGAQLPFEVTDGIRFGFGAYVRDATDEVYGTFDNAEVTGGRDPNQPDPGNGGGGDGPTLAVSRDGNNIEVEWDDGNLQSAPAVTGPWSDVMDGGSPAASPWTEAFDEDAKYFRAVVE